MTRKQIAAAISQFKRNNPRKTRFGSRFMLAYNIPGTREHGSLAMLRAQLQQFAAEAEDTAQRASSPALS